MEDFFQTLLRASISGSVVICVIILLRFLLHRSPKTLVCLLWLLAGLRLLVPFEIESNFSLQPRQEILVPYAGEPAQQILSVPEEPARLPEGNTQADTVQNPPQPQQGQTANYEMPVYNPPARSISLDEVLPVIWLSGVAAMLLVGAIDYGKLRRKVREAWKCDDGCMECSDISTAFLLGFIHPRIYLPSGIPMEERRILKEHELTHKKLGHHWFKLLGYCALAIHWFNPFVWLGFSLMSRDLELACDERMIRKMDLNKRKEYSQILLDYSIPCKRPAPFPLSFGGSDAKGRIMSVLNYRKPGFWLTLAGVVALVFVAVCLMTSPKDTVTPPEIPEKTYQLSEYSRKVVEEDNPSVVYFGNTLDYESEYAEYLFDTAFSDAQRDAYVFFGDNYISKFTPDTKPEVFILKDYEGAWISGDTLYLGAEPDSLDYGAKLITLLCGGYANYGAAYGYAEHIAVECGWEEKQQDLSVLTEHAARDLNWLCFYEQFVPRDEIRINQTAAACFAEAYIQKNGEAAYRQLLLDSGAPDTAERFSNALGAWYAENGLSWTPGTLLYGMGGAYHEYIVQSVYAEFRMPRDWDNDWTSALTEDPDFLHRSYEEIKYCFEINVYQMGLLQEELGFDSYDNDLNVRFTEVALSNTDIYHRTIHLNSVEDLPILYVYWLTGNPMRDRHQPFIGHNLDAGMAHYVSLKVSNVYKEAMLHYCAENGWKPEMYTQGDWNDYYTQMLEGETDPMTIQRTRFDFGAYYFEDYYSDPGMGNATSFPWYLIEKYGYETMLDYIYIRENDPIELDLLAERKAWIQWLETKYADYPQYETGTPQETQLHLICWKEGCSDPWHDHSGRDCTVEDCTDVQHQHNSTWNDSSHHDDHHSH